MLCPSIRHSDMHAHTKSIPLSLYIQVSWSCVRACVCVGNAGYYHKHYVIWSYSMLVYGLNYTTCRTRTVHGTNLHLIGMAYVGAAIQRLFVLCRQHRLRELIIDGRAPRFKSGKEMGGGLPSCLNSDQRAAIEKVCTLFVWLPQSPLPLYGVCMCKVGVATMKQCNNV